LDKEMQEELDPVPGMHTQKPLEVAEVLIKRGVGLEAMLRGQQATARAVAVLLHTHQFLRLLELVKT